MRILYMSVVFALKRSVDKGRRVKIYSLLKNGTFPPILTFRQFKIIHDFRSLKIGRPLSSQAEIKRHFDDLRKKLAVVGNYLPTAKLANYTIVIGSGCSSSCNPCSCGSCHCEDDGACGCY